MPINIHGKQYVTVAERVEAAGTEFIGLETEVITHEPVVIKATVKTSRGTFTGISAANPSKQIEKMSPYEVAETSAVGRALGFAGYGIVEGIASADEMSKPAYTPVSQPKAPVQQTKVEEPDNLQKQLLAQPCKKCGGPMAFNRNKGTIFCERKCWLKGSQPVSRDSEIDELLNQMN